MFSESNPQLFPMQRFPQFFGGLAGIPGTAAPYGQRIGSKGIVLYVDTNTGVDTNYGFSPEVPFKTIGAAVASDLLVSGSVIYVAPGLYSESVVTDDYVLGANYVSIVGAGNSRWAVQWESGAAASPCLDLRALGWSIEGIKFYGPVTEGSIQLRMGDTNANDIASRTIIRNCQFDGLAVGRYGIVSHGAADVWVEGCTFSMFHNAVGGGAIPMLVDDTPVAVPYRNYIRGNHFSDSDNGAVWPANGSFFEENVFQPAGYTYAMTLVLQTSLVAKPGDDNIVRGNYFPGDYSIAGGYRAGAADMWFGNMADDVLEAEVSDSGITLTRPAA